MDKMVEVEQRCGDQTVVNPDTTQESYNFDVSDNRTAANTIDQAAINP